MRRAVAHFQFAGVRKTTICLRHSVFLQFSFMNIAGFWYTENGTNVFIESKDCCSDGKQKTKDKQTELRSRNERKMKN